MNLNLKTIGTTTLTVLGLYELTTGFSLAVHPDPVAQIILGTFLAVIGVAWAIM